MNTIFSGTSLLRQNGSIAKGELDNYGYLVVNPRFDLNDLIDLGFRFNSKRCQYYRWGGWLAIDKDTRVVKIDTPKSSYGGLMPLPSILWDLIASGIVIRERR